MSNSSLVNYIRISPNKTVMSNKINKKITIHHMAGNLTVERCGEIFAPTSRQASANYGIGSDGRVGLYVEEKDRAWTSSSRENDSQAVTIEVANDEIGGNWHVSDVALAKTIDLCVDICRRNGIEKLNFTGNKSGNLTMHSYFAATQCPGPYLKSKFSYIASEVNKRLSQNISIESNSSNITTTVTNNNKTKINSDIKSVQIWLNTYYSAGLDVDGIYGSRTKKALIKAWQTEIGGLTVDGIFGSQSRSKASSNNIKLGSRGIVVTIWQAYLVCNGYNPNGIDGIFGNGCVIATKKFQSDNKLSQDGIVGKDTLTKAFA